MSGAILWFTGLSGGGKSTLANAVGARLKPARPVEILDGDEVRTHLSKGLGFTKEDRDINVHRIGFVSRLLARHGVFVITAAISPYATTRQEVRALAAAEGIPFIEAFVNPTLESLVARDVKGLYRRALAGEIPHFTGVSDPYEPPSQPDIVIRTDAEPVDASVDRILGALVDRGIVPAAVVAGPAPGADSRSR
ncbi:MAG: adenylyl-sulfate kinase [Luteitalea sp.]|nr:adenylyl-sulfate kinase [Luteitalea sp.]